MILKMSYIFKVFQSFNIILQNNTEKNRNYTQLYNTKRYIVLVIREDNKLNIYKISIGWGINNENKSKIQLKNK